MKKDFSVLDAKTHTGSQMIVKFNDIVEKKVAILRGEQKPESAEMQYKQLCDTINFAINAVLPEKENKKGMKRIVSERTRDLFNQRTKMGRKDKWTKVDFAKIQEEIKKSSLQDHTVWVSNL